MSLEERAQRRTIGAYTYEVTPVIASKGHKALLRLIKLASPVLGELIGKQETGVAAAAAASIRQLAESIDDEDLRFFKETFGPSTRVCEAGAEDRDAWVRLSVAEQETHWGGNYLEMLDWLRFSCECNFGSFFAGSMQRLKDARAPKAAATQASS